LAIEEEHALLEAERGNIEDARERPVKFYGYSIGYRVGHLFVRDTSARYRVLVEAFLACALTSSAELLVTWFRALPFEPYGPVKVQRRRLLSRVNELRKAAGLHHLDTSKLRTKREVVRPFAMSGWLDSLERSPPAAISQG
jgi:hypothetical protein